MSDLVGNHNVGFPRRRLKYKTLMRGSGTLGIFFFFFFFFFFFVSLFFYCKHIGANVPLGGITKTCPCDV